MGASRAVGRVRGWRPRPSTRAVSRSSPNSPDPWQPPIERVYWFTVEFGLVEESGRPRALGAGLLSSVGELRACASTPELCPFDLDRIAASPYDPTRMQERLFVAPCTDRLVAETLSWLRGR
ncbi:MAG: hypothetical protein CMJ47_02060 [Planctomyces sp.]|nr:hypothetical protein [Planctomyces sp.]